jgi:hypothetical protein
MTDTRAQAFEALLTDAEECAYEWASAAMSCGHALAGYAESALLDKNQAAFREAIGRLRAARDEEIAAKDARIAELRPFVRHDLGCRIALTLHAGTGNNATAAMQESCTCGLSAALNGGNYD